MALTQKQIKALKVLAAKQRDTKDRPFVDRSGTPNLVARVRKTRKGKKISLVSDNCRNESAGVNGREYYVIRRASTGQGTGLHLYCSCPAQRFHAKYGNACKHIKRLVAETPALFAAGERVGPKRDLIIYNPKAVVEALHHFGQETEGLIEEVA
jgi:hypothetical protein